MCIIIHKNSGVTLTDAIYQECFGSHDDGGGFAFIKDGELVIKRGYFNFKKFLKDIRENETLEMLIHCRTANRGTINVANCHPFRIVSSFGTGEKKEPRFEFAVVHNGTIFEGRSTAKKSDTMCFIEDVLKPCLDRDPWFLNTAYGIHMIGRTIGFGNKMAIMAYDRKEKTASVHIINKSLGNEAHNCWFSNYSYLPVAKSYRGYMAGVDWWDRDTDREDINYGPQDKMTDTERLKSLGWEYNELSRMWENKRLGLSMSQYPLYRRRLALDSPNHVAPGKPDVVDIDAKNDKDAVDKWLKEKTTGKIEVPRDPGIGTAKPSDKIIQMDYLNREDRTEIYRTAREYVMKEMGAEYAKCELKPIEEVQWLRTDVQKWNDVLYSSTDQEVDEWMIEKIHKNLPLFPKEPEDAKAIMD